MRVDTMIREVRLAGAVAGGSVSLLGETGSALPRLRGHA